MTLLQLPGYPFAQVFASDASASVITSITNYPTWTIAPAWVTVGFNPSSTRSEGWVVTIAVQPVGVK